MLDISCKCCIYACSKRNHCMTQSDNTYSSTLQQKGELSIIVRDCLHEACVLTQPPVKIYTHMYMDQKKATESVITISVSYVSTTLKEATLCMCTLARFLYVNV